MINFQQHRLGGAVVVGMWLATSFLAFPMAEAFMMPSSRHQLLPPEYTGAIHHDAPPASYSHICFGSFQRNRLVLKENSDAAVESGMVVAKNRNLLNMAFSSLDDKDKYDTVLTGLCAKVIDGGASSAKQGLIDPIRLLEEMNSSRIVAGPRGIISLVDATVLTSDARIMSKVLSLAIGNGAITNYGSLQGTIDPIPQTSNTFTFGSNKKDQIDRLNNLPPVPDDDRATEVTQAIAFSSVVGSCLALNVFGGLFGLEDATPWSNLILGIAFTTFFVDNFFDVIVMGGSAVAKMNEEKLPDSAKRINAPNKQDMPFGIGTGSLTGAVFRGLSRLLSVNTERDCQCEAAAVFAAYSLGLPCFAFQPNALEGAALVVDSMKEPRGPSNTTIEGKLDNLASDAGLLKVLIWLMAPVAMEISKYPQLISSDPREAVGFLQRLTEKSRSLQSQELSDALPEDDVQLDRYLRWALAEADRLLRNNRKTVDTLSEALAGGAATVGDCVAVLEAW
ncbi:hypothetical protein HJC23_000560 [Cyclotella cryptica]|uniref:H(+)-exporting diphosphatase n=1 Tax=Cyclotella cryptica TaxID=29204 RepID=A0ABD3PSP3_9STRA|eukprot:CCRYP_011738-RB/>CCRYP_011738-RB protein AED:0.06 eAED:0.06 QI:91/1/1/1/0.66/0.5/4/274/505